MKWRISVHQRLCQESKQISHQPGEDFCHAYGQQKMSNWSKESVKSVRKRQPNRQMGI